MECRKHQDYGKAVRVRVSTRLATIPVQRSSPMHHIIDSYIYIFKIILTIALKRKIFKNIYIYDFVYHLHTFESLVARSECQYSAHC